MSEAANNPNSAGGARIGQVLGGTYKLVELIGEGGMGEVYAAEHLRLKNRCAVKLMTAAAKEQQDVIHRFKREAEIAAGLGSDQIVKVFDLNDTDDGVPYLVMEVLRGEDLADRLEREGPLAPEVWAPLLDKVAAALDLVHKAGVVHRDLKPANIFLHRTDEEREVPKILDFGISKIRGSLTAVTKDIAFLGTPQYMSPEQAGGGAAEVDHRSDIFSLGTMTYEALTGNRPFVAPTPVGIMYQICHNDPTPLGEQRPDLPAALAEVVHKALARKPEGRYPTAGDFAAAFREALGMDESLATSEPPTQGPAEHAEAPAENEPQVESDPGDPAPEPEPLSMARGTIEESPRRSSATWLVLGAGLVAVIALLGYLVLRKGGGDRSPPDTNEDERPAATRPVTHFDAGSPADAATSARPVDPVVRDKPADPVEPRRRVFDMEAMSNMRVAPHRPRVRWTGRWPMRPRVSRRPPMRAPMRPESMPPPPMPPRRQMEAFLPLMTK